MIILIKILYETISQYNVHFDDIFPMIQTITCLCGEMFIYTPIINKKTITCYNLIGI